MTLEQCLAGCYAATVLSTGTPAGAMAAFQAALAADPALIAEAKARLAVLESTNEPRIIDRDFVEKMNLQFLADALSGL